MMDTIRSFKPRELSAPPTLLNLNNTPPFTPTSAILNFLATQFLARMIVPSTNQMLHTRISGISTTPTLLPNEEQISVKTSDDLLLDGIKIKCISQSDKWILYTLPNIGTWQALRHHEYFKSFLEANLNILCVNYRGSGSSLTQQPRCFDDLVIDAEGGLNYLLTKLNVSSENIILHGHSLGGAVALHLGARRQLPTIVQSTFSSLSAVAECFIQTRLFEPTGETSLSIFHPLYIQRESTDLPWIETALFSLKDALLSLPHLAIRVTFFFLSMFVHLIQGNRKEASKDLIEIGKTIVLDLTLTITGLASLILSPYTNTLNKFNGDLNTYFMERSAIVTITHSSSFLWVMKTLAESTGWNPDNVAAAGQLGAKLLVLHAEDDTLIPLATASLRKGLTEQSSRTFHNFPGKHFEILKATSPTLKSFFQKCSESSESLGLDKLFEEPAPKTQKSL